MSSAQSSAAHTSSPIPQGLLALAPLHLKNARTLRYDGGDLFVPLDRLAGADQAILGNAYRVLNELLHALADPSKSDDKKCRDIIDWVEKIDIYAFVDDVRKLGAASYKESPCEDLAKAMHDIRGGALSALLGRLQLLERGSVDTAQLNTLFVLTRDHLKIMRNAVVGLDDPRRDADRRPRNHDMQLVLDKWHEYVTGPERKDPVQMFVDCRYQGPVSTSCLESAAIDRIFYNIVNNAIRHAVGTRIDMAIFPIPEPPGDCLRFVLSNEVTEKDAAYLKSIQLAGGADSVTKGSGESLLALFMPEVSSTGSGFGMTVVSDFVAAAFGLVSRKEALHERYIGAVLEGRIFRTWFHWPMAHSDLPVAPDDFHRPDESLSDP